MKKYHIKSGDGNGYYGVGYESYIQATEVLKISQMHDPQAHIVEEEYHFTNADRIRAMSDEELAEDFCKTVLGVMNQLGVANTGSMEDAIRTRLEWLKQPAEVDNG